MRHRNCIALLALATAACQDPGPVAPAAGPDPERVATDTTPTPTPPRTSSVRPALIYESGTQTVAGSDRYVLFEDQAFSHNSDSGTFTGRYQRAGQEFTFIFDADARWHAIGTLHDDSLVVRYNADMKSSDFTDATYVLTHDGFAAAGVIHLASSDGSAIAPLTRGSSPAWSPDGQHIAFHRDYQVHVISVDGSDDIALVPGTSPSWSPDGTRIVFVDQDGIKVMNTDGSDITLLLDHDFRDDTYAPWDMGLGEPVWSPDGHQIAFHHHGDGDMEPGQIYIMNADGSNPRRLTNSTDGRRYAEYHPDWSPDGAEIVFWSYGYGIATAHADEGIARSIHDNIALVHYGSTPSWSPDGRTIAFTESNGRGTVRTVPITRGAPTTLIADAFDPDWSSDSRRIAFVRGRTR